MMRISLKPFKPPPTAATLRRFSADLHPEPPSTPSSDFSSPISQTLSLLQTTDPSSWLSNPNLHTLLSSLSPPSVLRVTRQLPSYQNALRFFNHLKTAADLSDSVPLAFQAVLEVAMRENPGILCELFVQSKEQNIPLSANAATLLIRYFGRAKKLDEMRSVFDAIEQEMKNTDILNLVIAGYLNWGRIDDALKLLDEMLEPDSCCPPNTNTGGIVFSSILKRKWSGRKVTDEEICKLVLSFSEHGVSPSGFSFWFTQIIKRFCGNRDFDKAWVVLQEGMKSGCDISVASCNVLLAGLAQNHDFTKMNLLMKEMNDKGIKPNIVTYGITINQLCKLRRVDEALEVLEKMRDGKAGVKPDVVIYNTLIAGLSKVGRQDEGLKLMEKMRSESKCQPNTITYNCLIDGFCKAGEIERGHELFEQMSKDGVEINVITLNTMVDGMCKHGRVSSAIELFNSMRDKGLKGNAVTYTVLITAFCSVNNIDKAIKLFDEMQENGCHSDAVVYYSLISGLCQAGRMDDATFIVSKLKEAGFCLDVVSYNTLIGGFCRKKKLDRAAEILKEMETAGVKPDRVTYNTLLSFFCSSGDFKHAHKVMKKMIDDGLTPNVVTYGAMIQAYCSNKNIDVALKIYKDMCSSSKVPPNTVIYNMLIDSLCKNDDVEAALTLMDDMKEKQVRPNSNTYNALFNGLKQRNMFDKALIFMDQMTEEACNPDYVTMEILTEWLSAVGEVEKLRKFVQGYQVSASTMYENKLVEKLRYIV